MYYHESLPVQFIITADWKYQKSGFNINDLRFFY